MARLKSHGRMKTPALVILVAGFFIVLAGLFSCLNRATADNQDTEGAKKAFAEAAEVLFHPRCMNCHPSGDAPTIRDDSQPHLFNVKRGPEGKGARGDELHAVSPGLESTRRGLPVLPTGTCHRRACPWSSRAARPGSCAAS